jgi:hypothetical protein
MLKKKLTYEQVALGGKQMPTFVATISPMYRRKGPILIDATDSLDAGLALDAYLNEVAPQQAATSADFTFTSVDVHIRAVAVRKIKYERVIKYKYAK